ncbi:MAG: hypothetical protein ACE5FS_03450 [Paracoccaceae bacterium]
MKARIYATFSDGCCCSRPHLNAVVIAPMEPTFRFAKAAKELSDRLGAVGFELNKRGSDRSACAVLPVPCNHRDRQAVRFDWGIAQYD